MVVGSPGGVGCERSRRPKETIIGHEPLAKRLIEHGVPALADVEHRLFGELRAGVAVTTRRVGKARQHIKLGDDARVLRQRLRRGRSLAAQPLEQKLLAVDRPGLGGRHLLFEHFQFGSGVALGVLECLLA